MGTAISKYAGPVTEYVTGRKRKFESDEFDEAMNKTIKEAMQTPKRKKLRTAEYIYKTLFKEGKNSDIRVMALGKSFSLHKIYLCQSPYFSSMFGGSWLESTKHTVPIEIVDPQITVNALDIVFGSLYLDEIVLEPANIIGVLATATLFQLDNIIEQCIEIMLDTINPKTVVNYYNAGCEYGVQKVKDSTFKWLEVNLLNYYSEREEYLKKIPTELLTLLIASPNLFVMQTEFSAYLLLRSWLFQHIVKSVQTNNPTDMSTSSYFSDRTNEPPFLHTREGRKYIKPFQALKVRYLLLHHTDIEIIHQDNIIPKDWLHPEILLQWYSMLKLNQNVENGPKNISEEEFFKNCLRCGRVIPAGDTQMWRWTGFHFGLDLVIISDGLALYIKRNHRSENEQMLSLQIQRNIIVRVTAASVDKQLQIKHVQTSGLKSISFAKNEEQLLLTFNKELRFPLYVSVNLLLTSPFNMDFSSLEKAVPLPKV